MLVIVDGVHFDGINVLISNKEEQGEIKVIEFSLIVNGESEKKLYENSLGSGIVEIKIPEKEIEIKAKRNVYSYSYQKDNFGNKKYELNVTYEETDGKEPWSLQVGQSVVSMINWTEITALFELLESKNLITKEEFTEKIKIVKERDSEKMHNYLFKGK
ncbi:hypothetical protein [Rummeliibacillus pycnus]|uniref:hypothetical protein n=1 Tax=Rummeliibacillus pycnus TaxID=101070 RepID=UPI0037C6DC75